MPLWTRATTVLVALFAIACHDAEPVSPSPRESSGTEADGGGDADINAEEDSGDADRGDATEVQDSSPQNQDNEPSQTLADGIEIRLVDAYQSLRTPLFDSTEALPSAVPLVAGRATLFQVSVALAPGWSPAEIRAQVVLEQSGDQTNETYEQTRLVTAASTPDDRDSHFEILVPAAAFTTATSASIRLIGDGETEPTATADHDARWPRDGSSSALLATDTTGTLKLVLVPMRYEGDGSGRLPDTSAEQQALIEELLRALYPIYDLELSVREPITWSGGVSWGSFTQELRALKMSDGAEDAYYYGLIRPAETFDEFCGGSCTTGQSYLVASADSTSYRVGAGLGFSGSRWAWTLAHELGHMHGRRHAPCGVSFWSRDRDYPYAGGYVGVAGWDRRSDAFFDPDVGTDFMGYCNDQWISDYTYMGILERMEDVGLLQQTLVAPEAPPSPWRYIDWRPDKAPAWGRHTQEQAPETGRWAQATFLSDDGTTIEEISVPLIVYAHRDERSVLVPEAPQAAQMLRITTAEKTFELPMPAEDADEQ